MYEFIFYLSSAIAVVAAGAILVVRHPVHAALYLIVSLLALALLFFLLGAPLLAALQVMLYAGAIMVLFLFMMMVMNLRTERNLPLLLPGSWGGIALLALLLWLVLLLLLSRSSLHEAGSITVIEPKEVGSALFGPYLVVVEAAAILLLAALVAALYLSRRGKR
ncbi:NADH-quinone oxidoreductase subunit J [Nitrosomonas sp. Is37]|uniref:NADH-quinone oxidoreductase subunit J family protein n=1 Tax=Nitrosomonas sp. Is37 TaxID=3080535 RepID=UPI00294B24C1|nr:NADH-quinone oxidoreductase subunit J [Nitrosomonas sp. Is37]MDV6344085.1 NADH-quinone oxidoreductase subunit J [Nitrosomonas sp. Is37]